MSPVSQIKQLIVEEKQDRPHHDWWAVLPAVLWSMRTQKCHSRGASAYELVFGRRPQTELDLLYGQPIQQSQFKTANEYLLAKQRRDELANAFAKRNIAKAILRQRKYYSANFRNFEVGEKVSLFTPGYDKEVSAKFYNPWSGPWQVLAKLGQTTYSIGPIEGMFVRDFQPMKVQVDRLKLHLPSDPVVTPPLGFTGWVPVEDQNMEFLDTPTSKKINKYYPNKDEDEIAKDQGAKDPWDPYKVGYSKDMDLLPDLPTGEQQPPASSFKAHKRKNRFSGLPCPPITRSQTAKLRQQTTQTKTVASLSSKPPSTTSAASGYVHDDVTCAYLDLYDPHMYHR